MTDNHKQIQVTRNEEYFKAFCEKYSGSTTTRALVQFIPFGGVLDALIGNHGLEITLGRIELMIKCFKIEIEHLYGDKVSEDFFGTEEWFDIATKAIEVARKDKSEKKKEFVAKVLAGAVKNKEVVYRYEEYLDVLGQLKEKEILVLLKAAELLPVMKENVQNIDDKESLYKDIIPKHFPDIPKEDFSFIYSRIARTGLIRQITGTAVGYSGGDYELSPVLDKFIDAIKGNVTLN